MGIVLLAVSVIPPSVITQDNVPTPVGISEIVNISYIIYNLICRIPSGSTKSTRHLPSVLSVKVPRKASLPSILATAVTVAPAGKPKNK